MRDSDERRRRQRIGDNDSRGRRWWRMTMALNDNGTRELVAEDDGQGTRLGGEQRRHSTFDRGAIIAK